ncbi:MAG TPA: hypothetical protein VGK52_18920 [Polyangia bacterium]|jgi:hypothetical protein
MKTAARRRSTALALACALILAGGCHRHAASPDDCAAVFDRLVDLELTESGYRDPVLRDRWRQNLAHRFAPELARCHGLRVRDDLAPCLAAARTSENVAHGCLE